ncbi:MAG: hypothetical protein ABIP75_06875, partial [Pyrinomonadaceae bacterium]
MRHSIARQLCALLLLLVVVNTASAASVHRIRFARGAVSATVWGTLYGQHSIRHYILQVRAGQNMKVHVTSTQLTNPQIDVIYPNGEHMDRDMQGTQFNTDSTQAGNYRIDVYEGMKGDPGRGKF